MSDRAQLDLIRASGLFDPEFYRRSYGQWLADSEDPLHHFLEAGLAQGHLPSTDFDPVLYRMLVPECGDANPLLHSLESGTPFEPPPLEVLFPEVKAQIALQARLNRGDPQVELNRTHARDAAAAKEITFVVDGERHALTVPEPGMFLNRLRLDRPFALTRLTHGFWDAVWMLGKAEDALAIHELARDLPFSQRRALAARLCAALRPRTGTFAHSFIDELLADIPVHAAHPDFFRAVSFKGYPTFDEDIFGRRAVPPPSAVSRIFTAHFRPDERIYDATAWKRLLIAGDLQELPTLCRTRPVVLVASDLFATLGTRWRLDDFTYVEIPRSLAQRERQALLVRTAKALAAACARGTRSPAILMECGSLAPWLITRLFTKYPWVFYLDLGQALNGWFFDVVPPGDSPWARTYACSVIANCHLESHYRAKLGGRYEEWITTISRVDPRDRPVQSTEGGGTKDNKRHEILAPAELVGTIKAKKTDLFDRGLTDETAAALLMQAFEIIREQLNDTQEGEMQIKGLGVFQIRNVERGEGEGRVKRKVINLRLK